jgi:hypothetical protein
MTDRLHPSAALREMWEQDADRGVDVAGLSPEVVLPSAVSRPARPPFEIEPADWFEATP